MIRESGAVPGCPKTSVTTSRAKALPQPHNLLSQQLCGPRCCGQTLSNRLENPSHLKQRGREHPPSFFPWSLLSGDLLSHQVSTNSSARTRQHCRELTLPPLRRNQEPPDLLVMEYSSCMVPIAYNGQALHSWKSILHPWKQQGNALLSLSHRGRASSKTPLVSCRNDKEGDPQSGFGTAKSWFKLCFKSLMFESTSDFCSLQAEKLLVSVAGMHKKSRKEQGCQLYQVQPASLVARRCRLAVVLNCVCRASFVPWET